MDADAGSAAIPASDSDTVGTLLAAIATALQHALRIFVFADKRGWESDEFAQLRAIEDALDEARRDFQAMGPLVNGQFYYENDRRAESLQELRRLRSQFDDHTQLFRDWLRSGGPINPLWVRETVALRRQLHRAQCRAARRIFNAEHEVGDGSGSGARCLGAYLVYRRFREHEDARKRHARGGRTPSQDGGKPPLSAGAAESLPTWKRQQPQLYARELRRFAGQEPFRQRNGYSTSPADDATVALEMTAQGPTSTRGAPRAARGHRPPPLKSALKPSAQASPAAGAGAAGPPFAATAAGPAAEPAHTTIPLNPDEPPSPPPPPPTLEDLVPECTKVGTFERFGDCDIAFICDYCDGHIVWEDVQRLPTARVPPPAVSSAAAPSSYPPFSSAKPTPAPSPLATTPLPFLGQRPLHLPQIAAASYSKQHQAYQKHQQQPSSAASVADDEGGEDDYPRWQASTVAQSDPGTPRTVVFAPLAIANHLPPMVGDWEARLWCPYCDEYLYYDSAEGDQTRYAQDEGGFTSLADFQAHLEWHHTALPMPALPTTASSCAVM